LSPLLASPVLTHTGHPFNFNKITGGESQPVEYELAWYLCILFIPKQGMKLKWYIGSEVDLGKQVRFK